jgi:hypothetical protein
VERTQQDSGRDRLGRRAKRFLSPRQKYELWLQLVNGELSQSEAAERFGIDRSTVMRQGLAWARRRRIAYHRRHGKETRP